MTQKGRMNAVWEGSLVLSALQHECGGQWVAKLGLSLMVVSHSSASNCRL